MPRFRRTESPFPSFPQQTSPPLSQWSGSSLSLSNSPSNYSSSLDPRRSQSTSASSYLHCLGGRAGPIQPLNRFHIAMQERLPSRSLRYTIMPHQSARQDPRQLMNASILGDEARFEPAIGLVRTRDDRKQRQMGGSAALRHLYPGSGGGRRMPAAVAGLYGR